MANIRENKQKGKIFLTILPPVWGGIHRADSCADIPHGQHRMGLLLPNARKPPSELLMRGSKKSKPNIRTPPKRWWNSLLLGIRSHGVMILSPL